MLDYGLLQESRAWHDAGDEAWGELGAAMYAAAVGRRERDATVAAAP